ncbi:PAS domain-containing hybrid sensor histidine kinase/response regulator [Heliophilum fasciatum]|uniref:Stage 0 sporulation protein A homolog n=1 Tax=Heliophilum fasciatum TaxID=35700 RepID=A0A4R2S1D4_9FIRM|nr:response regulator [Heliophilum fasciatum]MCW2277565.1 PAS domain S-box-containing protein [Heliophilum fasciatum]TCP65145.1 PAS domain S-box-containing protein [Heliophilum fasciatum]
MAKSQDLSTRPLHGRPASYRLVRDAKKVAERAQQSRATQAASQKKFERYYEAIASSFEGFLMIDSNVRIVDCNGALCRLLGYERNELIGKLVFDLVSKESVDIVAQQLKLFSVQPQRVYDLTMKTKSGDHVPVRLHGSAHLDASSRLRYFYAFVTDMSDSKGMENDLRLAKEAAEKADQAKSDFLTTLNHEIQQPLNSITGIIELLSDTSLTQDQRELCLSLMQSSQLLLTLINDIVNFSKMETQRFELEPVDFDLHQLVRETTNILVAMATEKGLSLNLRIDPTIAPQVHGDPSHLKQVLLNLIGNTIKFTDHGYVDISMTVVDQRPSIQKICFTIRGTGNTLTEEKQKELFQPFIEENNTTDRRLNLPGLALSISQRLVQSMNGEIHIQSPKGQGLLMWFAIPLQRAQDNQPPASVQALDDADHQQPTVHNILLVEDNPLNVTIASTQLQKLGYSVTLAGNGREALEQVAQGDYSLILMDCQMPLMDGYEATRRIRQTEKGKNIPIIAMTAFAMHGDRDKCLNAGMDDYLSKPVSKAILQKTLSRWIQDQKTAPAPPTGSRAFAHIPSVDFLTIKEYQVMEGDDDPNLVNQLLQMFLKESSVLLTQLITALKLTDIPAIIKLAHSLKSASSALGALRLAAICAHYEAIARANHLDQAPDHEVLQGEWDEVNRIFKGILTQGLPRSFT